jgi:hypothetical protein
MSDVEKLVEELEVQERTGPPNIVADVVIKND